MDMQETGQFEPEGPPKLWTGRPSKRLGRPADNDEAAAERRRVALRSAIQRNNMTIAELTRLACFPSRSLFDNFFGRRTKSLSAEKIAVIARILPNTTFAELMGEDEKTAPVNVRAQAKLGTFRRSFDLDLVEQYEVAVPVATDWRRIGAYGVEVRSPGPDEIFCDYTILIAVPVDRYEPGMATGRRVILQRIDGERVEVSVREVRVVSGRAWLLPRTTQPEHMAAVSMPWPYDGRPWKQGDQRLLVAGVVVMNISPQG